MANISSGIFMLLLMAAMSIGSVRVAWLHWIDSDRAPNIPFPRSTDPSLIAGHERGVVALAGWMTCMTLGILLGTLSAAGSVGVGLFLGSFLLLAMHFTIAWFNWPRFLVPPHRRTETGSIVEWFRWRRDIRIALKEAAERDALGQHPDSR